MNELNGQNLSATEFSENLTNDLTTGLHSALFKRISNVTIVDTAIKSAFEAFISSSEFGDSFSVADIIFGTETILKGYEPEAPAGLEIYCFNKLGRGKASAKLFKYSVGGIYALLNIRNGLSIDLDAIGGSIVAGETKRFAILTPRRAAKLIPAAKGEGVEISRVGQVLASNAVLIYRDKETLASIDKGYIYPKERESLNLDSSHREDFLSGYHAACGYACCRNVTDNNVIRFGLGGDLSRVCARALGYFSAMLYLKALPANIVFTHDSSCTVAVPRPKVADGDYLYLLKVRTDSEGMPDRIHHGQLNYYLAEMAKRNIIKDVLPLKENVESTIYRLCGDELEYVALADIPQKCFGVIVSVGRGNSVNGIKLGYFKNIEVSPQYPEE